MSSIQATSRSSATSRDDLDVLGLHVSPDLDSILYTLDRSLRRGARLGPGGRELARARDRRGARRRVVVPPGRPRPRPASRTHAAPARGRDALRGDRADRARARARARAAPGDRRPASARFSRRLPGRFRSRRGSSRAVTATRSTPCTTPARRSAVAAPGVIDALRRRRPDRDRPEQPVRVDRADPRGRGDSRRARRPSRARASPSARSSAAARSRGRPTACCCDSPAARRPTHVASLLRRADRRARGRRARRTRSSRCGGVERTVVTQTLMTDLPAARRLAAATVHASEALA